MSHLQTPAAQSMEKKAMTRRNPEVILDGEFYFSGGVKGYTARPFIDGNAHTPWESIPDIILRNIVGGAGPDAKARKGRLIFIADDE
jgi:hypothetical protein